MAHCPISIIVPCHRVIHADGAVGGYSRTDRLAGQRRKAWLLEFEAELTTPGRSPAGQRGRQMRVYPVGAFDDRDRPGMEGRPTVMGRVP
jgi:hypothetical protein